MTDFETVGDAGDAGRVVAVLGRVADIWQGRLEGDCSPGAGSVFPWAQVRLSLAALLPGLRGAGEWLRRALVAAPLSPQPPFPPKKGRKGEPEDGVVSDGANVPDARPSPSDSPFLPFLGGKGGWGDRGAATSATLILAGNTPLLAWSPLCACLLAGITDIRVKLSRDETVWTPLFIESLREADPALAARITLHDFPGEDERTYALLQDADAVIAYGSDAAIAALRARTPAGAAFFGYGHAVSIGILSDFMGSAIDGFPRDVLMYNQQGCLSPHIVYCNYLSRAQVGMFSAMMSRWFQLAADTLEVQPVRNPAQAVAIQQVRALTMFADWRMKGDDTLRWTTIGAPEPVPYPEPIGHGVITFSPVESPEQLRELLQPVWGIVSCAGVAGELPPEWEAVLREAGVTRFCKPGEMQTPPLDWQNGGRDLLAELLRVGESVSDLGGQ